MAVMVGKWLKINNQNLGEYVSCTNFTWIVFIKFLAINLRTGGVSSQPFLGHYLWFHNLFTLLKGTHIFLQLRCFGIDTYHFFL